MLTMTLASINTLIYLPFLFYNYPKLTTHWQIVRLLVIIALVKPRFISSVKYFISTAANRAWEGQREWETKCIFSSNLLLREHLKAGETSSQQLEDRRGLFHADANPVTRLGASARNSKCTHFLPVWSAFWRSSWVFSLHALQHQYLQH